MLRNYQPCIQTRGTGPDRFHEVKHDGYGLLVQREGKRVRLLTATARLDQGQKNEVARDGECAIGLTP